MALGSLPELESKTLFLSDEDITYVRHKMKNNRAGTIWKPPPGGLTLIVS